MRWRITLLLVLALGATTAVQLRAAKGKSFIVNTKHDFRITSSASIHSVSPQDVCMFCHTPHNAASGPMIWNQKLSERDFPKYSSSTLQSAITPIGPQDSSKLCLSCHDGTIALGDTENDGLIQFVTRFRPLHLRISLETGKGSPTITPSALCPSTPRTFITRRPETRSIWMQTAKSNVRVAMILIRNRLIPPPTSSWLNRTIRQPFAKAVIKPQAG
jgi:hypothetical protein